MGNRTRRAFLWGTTLPLVYTLVGCGGSSNPEPPGGLHLPEDPNDLPIMKDAAALKAQKKGKRGRTGR